MSQSTTTNLLLLLAFILLIYFMMIRPQKKKDKADREMRASLKVGDEIMTIGGIIGKVTRITDKTVIISTGADKNKIELIKTAIASVTNNESNGSKTPIAKKEKTPEPEAEVDTPNRDKKVTPKKLGKQ